MLISLFSLIIISITAFIFLIITVLTWSYCWKYQLLDRRLSEKRPDGKIPWAFLFYKISFYSFILFLVLFIILVIL